MARTNQGNDLDIWCPFASLINQHAATVDQRTFAWMQQFGLFKKNGTDRARAAGYGLLAARAYPNAEVEALQVAADWISWLFLKDDECDEAEVGSDPESIGRMHERLTAIVQGKPPLTTDHQLGHALHDLRTRMAMRGPPEFLVRFAQAVERYFAANRWEANTKRSGGSPRERFQLPRHEATAAVHRSASSEKRSR